MSHKTAKHHRQVHKDDLRDLLLDIVKRLRRVLAQKGPDLYKQFPNMKRPCHTCAFNPQTDEWVGFDATILRLLTALGTSEPFYCHDGMPIVDECYQWPESMESVPFCGGWAVVAGLDETAVAFVEALAEWKGGAPLVKKVDPEKAEAELRLFAKMVLRPMAERGVL